MPVDKVLLILVAACAMVGLANAKEPIKVLAAGSLTGAMNSVIKLYKDKTGEEVQADYGPAGLLLQRIEGGESVDVFASANMAHPRALADRGLAIQPVVMARNRVCAKALPAFGLTSQNFLDKMLDPKVGIGTSTPKADPGGDYAWLLFDKADQVRPGAGAILKSKAQQVVGGKNNPTIPAGKNAMDYYFEQHKVDISIGYCSSHEATPDRKLVTVQMPSELTVIADYGLTILFKNKDNREAALRFAFFVMSPEAQRLIGSYGFEPVGDSKGAL